MTRLQFVRSDDPRAAGPGEMLIPSALANLGPALAGVSGSVSDAADALWTLVVLMNEAFVPFCPCPGVTHTMRCGLGGRVTFVREETR
jgi:hypothetical protein